MTGVSMVFLVLVSSKMTKTDPNMKNNLQNRGKASKQLQEYKKTKKAKKVKKCAFHRSTMASIVPRWELLAGQENRRNKSEEYLFIVLR
ncbi:hypothetical protein QL285_010316 [Trifolium repens]|nr:hypothetical protein QL285_010316 [Trifolium repens]